MAITADEVQIGDWVVLADGDGVRPEFRGKRGKVTGWRNPEKSGLLVDFPDLSPSLGIGPKRIGFKNIASVESAEPEPTQEEVEQLFGIKKDDEVQAEAEKLISICHSNILRLEARVLRLEANESDNEGTDFWKEVVVAKNEVKLARAAGLELEADYIERWGTQAHRKAFT